MGKTKRQAEKYINGLSENINQDELLKFLRECDDEIIDTKHAKKLIDNWGIRAQVKVRSNGTGDNFAEPIKAEIFQQLGRVCKKGALSKEILDVFFTEKLYPCIKHPNDFAKQIDLDYQIPLDEATFNTFCKACAEGSISGDFLTSFVYFLIGLKYMAGASYLNGERVRTHGGLGVGGKLTNIKTLYNLCSACEEGAISGTVADSLLEVLQISKKIPEYKFKVIEKAFAEDKRAMLREKIQVEHIPVIPAWKKVLLKTGLVLLAPFRVVVETVTLPFKLLVDVVATPILCCLAGDFAFGFEWTGLSILKLLTYPVVAPFAYIYSAIKNAKDTFKAIDSGKKLRVAHKYRTGMNNDDITKDEINAKTLVSFALGMTTTSVVKKKEYVNGSWFLPNKVYGEKNYAGERSPKLSYLDNYPIL